ncbi:MAG: hypothetical protein QHH15_05705 [Candidatus Thermoplasmatota archaeon]|nr:hypothetical protein [Candidatus Thermoplasmatota archaeon]
MKKKIIGFFLCMFLIGATISAVADWEPGDDYKMHFPQMPDTTGWDVNFNDWFLADDWQCSETGPVTDIHFWISWKNDAVEEIPFFQVSIYSNNPQGSYSKPLQELWTRTFSIDEFVIAGPWTGDQGWLEPNGQYFLHDHTKYYQINIKNIEKPFIQEIGTIYWLVIQMPTFYPNEVGWKTSKNQFMGAAVWGFPSQWFSITDPIGQTPINFAFVITSNVPKPNLDCNGTLKWTSVKTNSTVSGSFTVGNTGEPGSMLNWEISNWPSWGTWSFSPSSGTGLSTGNWVTINVNVVAPSQKNKKFTGVVEIRNKNDYSDSCSIDVSLKTPRTKTADDQIFSMLLQRFLSQFPALFWMLNLN